MAVARDLFPGHVLRRKPSPTTQELAVVVSKSEFNNAPHETTVLVIPIQYSKRKPSLSEVCISQKDYPQFLAADAVAVANHLKRTRKESWELIGELTIPDTNACLAALRSLFSAIPPQPK